VSVAVGEVVRVVGAFDSLDYLTGRVEAVVGDSLFISSGRFGLVEWKPSDGGYVEDSMFDVASALILERYGVVLDGVVEDYAEWDGVEGLERYASTVLVAALKLKG
jgi:hypothetical protein